MANLDDFLGEEPGQAEAVEPSAAVEPPKGETTPPAQEPARDEPAPAPPGEEGEPPAPDDIEGMRRALQATRNERKDWKGKASRLEGELAAIRAQMEALQKAPPPPPPAPRPPAEPEAFPAPPNAAEDPAGYATWLDNYQFNRRAHASEAVMRQEVGDEAVDAAIAVFRGAASANPRLSAALRLQPEPYRFVVQTAERVKAEQAEQAKRDAMLKEIGTDPAAYRQKVEAELREQVRAQLEAEMAQAAQSVPSRVALPQSLGTARSAAPRGQVIAPPEDFDDILRRK